MANTENKCVIVADAELPAGILANTAAILGMTLGKWLPECIGEDVEDGSGLVHMGITKIPIPILKGNKELIHTLRQKLYSPEYEDLLVVDFSDVPQSCMSYEKYVAKANTVREEDYIYLGVAIYGSKKKVNTLTGSLPLLR
ncbi:MAG: DUF2000 domain-containing protein [Clostridia bacterium]|nr:DUF2000 domain-containing protein [Clostridia bacterium]